MVISHTYNKIFGATIAVLTVFTMVSAAEAAYYYDQTGRAIYYDTYMVPGGQYYPPVTGNNVSYGYPNQYGYQYQYGYNSGSGNYSNTQTQRPNRPPIIWSSPVRDVTVGQSYNAGINGSDPDGDQLTYALINGPAGMSINASTGYLRWNATNASAGQTFSVTVGVSDGYNAQVTQSFVITAKNPPGAGGSINTGGNTSGGSSTKKTGMASVFGIFGGGGEKELAISNINIISGPKTVGDNADRNCEVYVTWNTSKPTSGQVVYGTVSQQSLTNYSYPETAPEGNSYTKEHAVKLGCLNNVTYFMRIVVFSDTERLASSELSVFPVTIRTQIPESVQPTSGNNAATQSNQTASVFGQFTRLLKQPILWIIIAVLIGWYIVLMWLRRINAKAMRIQAHASTPASSASHAAAPVEIPMLQVPHH